MLEASDAQPLVRRAKPGDVPALVALMRAFYAESDFELDAPWATSAFSTLLDDPALGCVWLAEDAGEAVGHVVLTVRFTMEHGAPSGYIDDLYVTPACRRRGVARALTAALVAECVRRDCRSLYVEVGEDNAAAMRLYRGLGLRAFEDGRVLLNGKL